MCNQVSMELVEKTYQKHRNAFESWQEGKPEEAWLDENGNLCIRYESGKWWHYRQDGAELSWW